MIAKSAVVQSYPPSDLLGPLVFLLFFVSGITSADKQTNVRPMRSFIKAEAAVCEHCGRDVRVVAAVPRPRKVG